MTSSSDRVRSMLRPSSPKFTQPISWCSIPSSSDLSVAQVYLRHNFARLSEVKSWEVVYLPSAETMRVT
ncbi:MAG: hypothetical protein ACTH8X_08065, partial [Corynebacterium variabile]|uniref:hypothetical protein n=1 Tax=Corynebacterium variabile TaxID=1727 RepID=UPI003F8E96B7